MSDDNQDEWVTQDRTFARFGIDQRRWVTNGIAAEWKGAIVIQHVQYPYHGMQVFDEPFVRTLELRCKRRDLPATDEKPAQKYRERMEQIAKLKADSKQSREETAEYLEELRGRIPTPPPPEPIKEQVNVTHKTLSEIGAFMSDGWGYADASTIPEKIKSLSDDKQIMCLLAAVVSTLTKMHNEIKKINNHLYVSSVGKIDDPDLAIADGMLETLQGFDLISDRDVSTLSTRAYRIILRGHFTKVSQLTEANLRRTPQCGPTVTDEILRWVAGK